MNWAPLGVLLLLAACAPTGATRGGSIAPPAPLGIYYGYPSLVNGAAGNESKAVDAFAAFHLVVLGNGLEWATHPDHAATQRILAALATRGVSTFGYISMGNDHPMLTRAQADAAIDAWRATGATGIFWDEAGADYGVTTERFQQLVDDTHAAGLSAFANAWDPADVLFPGTHLGRQDVYLAENWLGGDITAWAQKADKLADARDRTGVRIAAVATGPDAKLPGTPAGPYATAWWGAAMYGLDAFGYQTQDYGAATSALPSHDAPWGSYGTRFTEANVRHDAMGHLHERTTDAGVIRLAGAQGAATGATFTPLSVQR